MAQTGFTPISLYYTTTAAATPTAGNLVAGELALNNNDGKLFYKDSSGVVQTIATKASAALGGSTTGSGATVLQTSPTITTPVIDKITTSVANTSLGAGNASIMKNRIINGAMVIDQRNAGASITPADSQFSVDRWACRLTQSSKFSVQQNAGSVTPPVGFVNYLGVTSLSAYSVTSTDFFAISQIIEGFNTADLGWGTANAKTITLSFQVYSSLTGTFSGAILNDARERVYPFTYTISAANTWTTISVTLAGDTSGTWLTNNSAGIYVRFCLGAGSTRLATAGSWQTTAGAIFGATGTTSVVGTNGATFYITGVQLEVGSNATGFEYRIYGTELANCQRYYWRNTPTNRYCWIATGRQDSTTISLLISYPTVMRSAPTFNYSNLALSTGTIGSAVATYGGNTSSLYQIGATGGPTSGYVNAIQSDSAGVGYFEASSEL
jgi:hypothetical protein